MSAYSLINMTYAKKRKYIQSFILEGVSLDQAYQLTYCSEDEIQKLEIDKKFIAEIKQTQIDLSQRRLKTYNEKVNMPDARAADHLKRLQTFNSEVFPSESSKSEIISGNLIINKVRDQGISNAKTSNKEAKKSKT